MPVVAWSIAETRPVESVHPSVPDTAGPNGITTAVDCFKNTLCCPHSCKVHGLNGRHTPGILKACAAVIKLRQFGAAEESLKNPCTIDSANDAIGRKATHGADRKYVAVVPGSADVRS